MLKVSPQKTGLAVKVKAHDFFVQTWETQANLSFFLLLLVFTVFVLPSMGFGKQHLRLYEDCVYTVLVTSGVAIAWGRRKLFYCCAAVGLLAIAVRWMAFRNPISAFEVWREALTLTTILMIALILLIQIFGRGPVTLMRIQGAIAVYLLFGFIWSEAYMIAWHFNPAGFSTSVGHFNSPGDWTYFSFTTLTTLGYGDIFPTGQVTRMLAIAESLTGQLYLAVMIARLVAMQVVSWQEQSFHSSQQN